MVEIRERGVITSGPCPRGERTCFVSAVSPLSVSSWSGVARPPGYTYKRIRLCVWSRSFLPCAGETTRPVSRASVSGCFIGRYLMAARFDGLAKRPIDLPIVPGPRVHPCLAPLSANCGRIVREAALAAGRVPASFCIQGIMG